MGLLCAIAAILLLSFAGLCVSFTVYVNPTTGFDTQNCGTSDSPCASLSHSFRLARDMNEIELFLSSAVYIGSHNCNMSAENKTITISSQSTQTRGVVFSCGQSQWISLSNSSFVLQGPMTIANSTSAISASLFSNLTINSVLFLNNSLSVSLFSGIGGGAAIALTDGSSLTLSDSEFVGNRVSAAGVCVSSGICTVAGGAVYADASSTLQSIANCTFIGNTVSSAGPVPVFGGAVAISGNSGVEVSGSAFYNNSATSLASVLASAGGALYAQSSKLVVTNSNFSNNALICAGTFRCGWCATPPCVLCPFAGAGSAMAVPYWGQTTCKCRTV